jgi:hypothetical protein
MQLPILAIDLLLKRPIKVFSAVPPRRITKKELNC